jgi:cytochrome P450
VALVLEVDPPERTRKRALFSRAFTPRALAEMLVRTVVGAALARMEEPTFRPYLSIRGFEKLPVTLW